ncbi:MAG: HlyD family secretion protein [Candidatus Gastranaerophilales bacterium]|nr:HlyD family secretion protein [Candidatus Gastranaerophilales bacterium]
MEELKNENTKPVENETDAKKQKKKKIFLSIIGVIALIAGVYLLNEMRYQTTDDAYVETTTVSVAPKISGEIIEVYVVDNQHVKAGDPIAKIDPRDYQVRFNQADAAYKKKILDQKNAVANLKAVKSELEVANKDVDRYTALYAAGAVSKQTLDNAITKRDSLMASHVRSKEEIFSQGTSVADADLETLKAQRDAAALNLSYTTIYAPQDGTVSSKRVEKGMMVSAGSPLFTLVPTNVWVVANYKETQLEHMKPGMPVKMKIDTYPKHKFSGKIDSIQRSSGAKSSLFPPENAVGSFVKIVQRIPVKIVFTDKNDLINYSIVPGMSVEPRVKIK